MKDIQDISDLPDRSTAQQRMLQRAATRCTASGQRFTPLRRQVFSIIAASKRPITAYAILDQLRCQGRDAGPPTVYRTLDFLQQQQLVHRIESLNAFVACAHPDKRHNWQFLICIGCGETLEIEVPSVTSGLKQSAHRADFFVIDTVVEIRGRCAPCRQAAQ